MKFKKMIKMNKKFKKCNYRYNNLKTNLIVFN